LLAHRSQPRHLEYTNPAAIFGNAVGDHFLVLPALRALASLFPSHLSLTCIPACRRTFFSDIPLRAVHEIEMPRRGGERRFNAAVVARRIGKCDLLLSLNPWRSASLDRLVALLSPAPSVGFSPSFEVALPKRATEHVVDSSFRVPAYLDPSLRLDDFAFPLRLPTGAGARIRQFLKATAPGKRILAVHTESKPEKTWPPEILGGLVTAFLERHPDFVVFLLNFWKPKMKLGKFKDRVIHSRGLPLPYAFAVVRESHLFLGVDSSMLHAADFFRIPGVGLFGPTDPRRWGFRFALHRHICESRGMKYIWESRVLRALESLLRSSVRPRR